MTACLTVGLQKAGHKVINFDKLREIIQRLDENLAQFPSRLTEALQKYAKLDPTSAEGIIVLNTHFISQSSPDIWKKLKQTEEGLQTPQRDHLNLALKIFKNREEYAKLEKAQPDQAKYHLLATALHGSKPPSSNKERKPTGPCFKCGKEGHWARSCLKPRPPPRSMSQLWHKGTLEGRLPKSPSRDPDIPSWSRAGVLWPSSAQAPQTCHWSLKVPRAPGPNSHCLYGAQGNSYSGR